MLKRLLVENYALIDHLDITFPGGLVLITGETGAGKSILLGALSLVLGGRSEASVLKDRGRNCVVEAVFEDASGERIFRRVISPQGRSRSFMDDEPTGLEQLRQEAARLVDIHAQHQQLLLADPDFQRRVLDSYAGLEEAVSAHGRLWQSLQEARTSLAALDSRLAAFEREQDYLEFQHRQLVEASLKEGELEQLEEEQGRLAHAEAVREQLERVKQAFEGEDGAIESRLKEMAAALDKVAPYFPEFEPFRQRIESARIELKDIHDEVEQRGRKVEFSPERLAEVDERLSLLYGLLRKFGVATVEELIAQRDEMSGRLGGAIDGQLERKRLQEEVARLEETCAKSAAELHAARVGKAPALGELLQEQVRALEMPRARFAVEVTSRAVAGPDGADDIGFLFDANQRGFSPLAKCASGGELSRIMLCIKSLLAEYQGMPTLIFDEIDAGVSGSVAGKIGRLLARMGQRMQVLAITHLPQVASQGEAHFLVYKESGPDGVHTRIRALSEDERLHEIARLLSDESVTPEALANARALLQDNKTKQS